MGTAQIIRKKYTGKPDQFRFKLKGTNGKVIATSELYKNKRDVTSLLKKYFPQFEVEDLSLLVKKAKTSKI